jgi:hypothetical protein
VLKAVGDDRLDIPQSAAQTDLMGEMATPLITLDRRLGRRMEFLSRSAATRQSLREKWTGQNSDWEPPEVTLLAHV